MKRENLLLGAVIIILVLTSPAVLGREPLTFEERVKAQEAIEKVYYNHRIWPKENKTPKPAFEKMVSKETIEAKVTDYLKKSAALEKYWYRPITGEQLQAEMDRMAKGTKDPATLNELFKALNDDPYLIAECLARPVLADRLVRNWYANDERFHKDTREKAEEALKHLTPENFCSYPEGQYSKMTYKLEIEGREEREVLDPEDHSIGLSEKEFEKMFQEIPEEGKISGVIEKNDCFVILHTALKNEGEIIVEGMTFKKVSSEEWLKGQQEITTLPKTEGNVSMFLPPIMASGCVEGWDNGILDDVPEGRIRHTAVWTGSEMIIWGGALSDSEWTTMFFNTGGCYNPSTDTWVKTSTGLNAPIGRLKHTAIWTGNEMIIWGGRNGYGGENFMNTGGKYAPLNDTWTPTSIAANCPAGRYCHTAIWTGSEMIVWGGSDNYNCLNSGGRYNPLNDIWVSTSTGTGVPEERWGNTALWTGNEMIIWGGSDNYNCLNSGGRYNPSNDIWVSTSTGTGVPEERWGHTAVWTGTEMIIWGGVCSNMLNSGAKYNPSLDSWTPTSLSNAPDARSWHVAVWTGSTMVVWGGRNHDEEWGINSGGLYDPATGNWNSISLASAPTGRYLPTAVWTGTEMIIWGGFGYFSPTFACSLYDGGRYDPFQDLWKPVSLHNNPDRRGLHSAVWTGAEMIVWGGYSYQESPVFLDSGGKYNPSTDSWLPTSRGDNVPSPRYFHDAIWTGNEMIIWGGGWNTGGKYYPISDTWQSTSMLEAPNARQRNSAVWTGEEIIIWGGVYYNQGQHYVNTGGRYKPDSDTWMSISTSDAPSKRSNHSAVWTGSEMIVWGGWDETQLLNTGGRFDPISNSWEETSFSNFTPRSRIDHVAVWSGTEMIIWGGWDRIDYTINTGARYHPGSDSWTPIYNEVNWPEGRTGLDAIWTGSEMIVWGGESETSSCSNSGSSYNPDNDIWTSILIDYNTPVAREHHSIVWTGSTMITWGGEYCGSIYIKDGGIYYPGTFTQPSISGSTSNSCPTSSVSLSTPASYVSYQWSLDGSPISGATSSAYEATVSGSYTVSVTDSNGCSGTSDPHVVTITPCIPNILYQSHGTFTQVTGDGDSYFERGEKWSVPVTVTNSGNTPATNVTAQLTGNGITVCNATGSFGTIAAGGTGTFTFSFVIDDDFTPCGGNINFNLGSKACAELTPAGADETNLFSVQVGQIAAGVPTDLVLQPSTVDSYVNQGSAGTNYGSGATMSVQSRLSQVQRTLVMFDLSVIPEDSVINSATLELYASATPTTGLTLNVHRITGTWTEAIVSWTNQPAYNSTVDASLAGGTATGWKIWNIASLVQEWINGTSVNYGLIVKGSVENDKTALTYTFSSKENGTSGNRPILRINYTPPDTLNCDYIGSGECDAILAECAPGDTYENGQTWSGTSQSWPALTGATGYKLYRGILSGLPNLLTADPDSCMRYEGATTSIDLSSDDPSGESGRLYWYIVTGTNGSGEGPSGNGRIVNSSGNCE